METSLSHFHAGRLTEAIEELGVELRKKPASTKLRTFLFELLCFAGEFARAEKQLNILAEQDAKIQLGAVLYKSLLRAHQRREEIFAAGVESADAGESIPVRVNGKSYESCEDEDPRIGFSLEVYVSGAYMRIPYREIESVEIEKPTTLRDLFWIPAKVSMKEESSFAENGPHAHLPVLAPFSWKHKDDAVRLGRMSVVEESESGAVIPYGTKLLICGDEEVPLLEVRELAFTS